MIFMSGLFLYLLGYFVNPRGILYLSGEFLPLPIGYFKSKTKIFLPRYWESKALNSTTLDDKVVK